jgi:Tat protein secretion system quality control protein TatD with DNase activity
MYVRLYDAHNHLQDDRLAPCREAVLAAVQRENVVQMMVDGSCQAATGPRHAVIGSAPDRLAGATRWVPA